MELSICKVKNKNHKLNSSGRIESNSKLKKKEKKTSSENRSKVCSLTFFEDVIAYVGF